MTNNVQSFAPAIMATPECYVLVEGIKNESFDLPVQFGGGQSKVLDAITAIPCKCGQHFTDLFIMAKYATFYCSASKQWSWMLTPSETFKRNLRRSMQQHE